MVGGAGENGTGDVGVMENGSSGDHSQVPDGQNGLGWSPDDKQVGH